MSFDPHTNLGISTVATAPSPASSGTSLTVTTGHGSRFSATGTGLAFNCLVWPANQLPDPSNSEVVRVTTRAGDVFTIVRAQESSSARAIVVGDNIMQVASAKTFTDIETSIRQVFVGANQFEASGGIAAPTLSQKSAWPTAYDVWTFDHAVKGLTAKDLIWIPGNWPNVKYTVLWIPVAGSGSIMWSVGIYSVAVDNSQFVTNTTFGLSSQVAAALGGGGVISTVMGSSVGGSFNSRLARVYVARNGSDPSDSATGVGDLVGILLEAAP